MTADPSEAKCSFVLVALEKISVGAYVADDFGTHFKGDDVQGLLDNLSSLWEVFWFLFA